MTDDRLADAARALVRLVYQTFGVPLSPKWRPAVGRVETALDEESAAEARVRTQVAQELWDEAQRVRAEDWPSKVGIEYAEGIEHAVVWIEQHAAEPAGTPKEPHP